MELGTFSKSQLSTELITPILAFGEVFWRTDTLKDTHLGGHSSTIWDRKTRTYRKTRPVFIYTGLHRTPWQRPSNSLGQLHSLSSPLNQGRHELCSLLPDMSEGWFLGCLSAWDVLIPSHASMGKGWQSVCGWLRPKGFQKNDERLLFTCGEKAIVAKTGHSNRITFTWLWFVTVKLTL